MSITSSTSTQAGGSLSLEQLDLLLAEWEKKRNTASLNVIELMDNTTYRSLTGTGGFQRLTLTGITEQRATPALKALNELWGLFAELGKVLDLAQNKRKQIKGLFKADQVAEIAQLLTGPSVKVSTQLAFAKRSLLSPAEIQSGLSLDRIMQSMVQAYDAGKSVVLEIEATTDGLLQALSGSTREVEALRITAKQLGEADLPELDIVEVKLRTILDQVSSDPFGVQAGFEKEIEPQLRQARERLQGLSEIFEHVKRDLAIAHSTMTNLLEMHKKAVEAQAERQLKVLVDDAAALPAPPESGTISQLNDWLGRLDTGFTQGKWKPLRMGLANWSLQATERLHASQISYTANVTPLNLRQELRSYLDVLKTKAQAYGRSEDEELAAIEKAARALLYTRPTRLAEAEKLVNDYAKQVR